MSLIIIYKLPVQQLFYDLPSGRKTKTGDLFNYASCVIGASVIPLLFILAVASFIWGVVQYVINDQEEAKKAQRQKFYDLGHYRAYGNGFCLGVGPDIRQYV